MANVCWFDHERVLQRYTVSSFQFRIFLNKNNVFQMFSCHRQTVSVIFIFSPIYTTLEGDQFEIPKGKEKLICDFVGQV